MGNIREIAEMFIHIFVAVHYQNTLVQARMWIEPHCTSIDLTLKNIGHTNKNFWLRMQWSFPFSTSSHASAACICCICMCICYIYIERKSIWGGCCVYVTNGYLNSKSLYAQHDLFERKAQTHSQTPMKIVKNKKARSKSGGSFGPIYSN